MYERTRDEWVKTKEAAEILGISVRRLRYMADRKFYGLTHREFRPIKNRRFMFLKDELLFVARMSTVANLSIPCATRAVVAIRDGCIRERWLQPNGPRI